MVYYTSLVRMSGTLCIIVGRWVITMLIIDMFVLIGWSLMIVVV
jgi:hypothetical protein